MPSASPSPSASVPPTPLPAAQEVIEVIYQHILTLFPKPCPNCGRVYTSYQDYLATVEVVGKPISYDIEVNDFKPVDPSGNFSFANCPCGNTLTLTSQGMAIEKIWLVLAWVKAETKKRQCDPRDVLDNIRTQVRERGMQG
ncbi:MAG TPA: hypothetical protein VF607_02450 [Verrucomicrobiae bacterium]